MSIVKLIYKDTPIGIEEDTVTTVTDAEPFSAPDLLPYGASTGAVPTFEHNAWGLSNDYKIKDKQPFALWTKSISNSVGVLDAPAVITLDFLQQYTSTGITIRFSPDANEYCTKISVLWYQGEEIKASNYYYPTSPVFILENKVEAFDKIVIALYETNLPQRRAKIEYIAIGIVREYERKEITDANFINEISLVGDTLPTNILDASFIDNSGIEFSFQKEQQVEAYIDNKFIDAYYVEKGERTGENSYNISCQNVIWLLDGIQFAGGGWLTDILIEDVLYYILGDEFKFELSDELKTRTVKGFIPPTTKREAVLYVAFAVGACVETIGNKIRLFKPSATSKNEISGKETYTGGKIDISDVVTGVSLTAYSVYRPSQIEEYPENSIRLPNGSFFYDKKIYTATNPNTTSNTPTNIQEFECSLISWDDAQTRADELLNIFMRRNTYVFSHILNGQKTGDKSSVYLPWGDMAQGHIKKMTIKVSGIIASDTEMLLD